MASVENQLKAIVPTNPDTNTIVYNERFVISDNPLRRIAWEVSKVENTTTFGLTKLTFTQELEHDSIDNWSWINFDSDNYSDAETGIEYDFYKIRGNDNEIHTMEDPYFIDESIISYTGVKPAMKAGGSFKKFTARFLNHGEFVESKPYWKIEYRNSDALICTVRFIYADGQLVCNNSDEILTVDKNKITYVENNEPIFGIKYLYDPENPMDIQLKCLPILNMIGGSVVLNVADEESITSASLTVEVEGL